MEEQPTVRVAAWTDERRRIAFLVIVIAGVGMIGLAVGPGFILAQASTANISTQWFIGTDLSMSVSYPTGQTSINFHPAASTFAGILPSGQTNATAAVAITNSGNAAEAISLVFTGHMTSGIAEFELWNGSTANAPTVASQIIYWCGNVADNTQSPAGHCTGSANDTTSHVLMNGAAKLAAAGVKNLWAETWGTTVAAGTQTSTLQATSS